MPFPGGKRGQEAINALKDRMPEIASQYGKSAEKLREIFLQDSDLWLDPADNLLYLCSFNLNAAEILPESLDPPIPGGSFPLDQTFQLHSLAGASKIIYLDFDGHVTSGTIWNSNFNGGADIVSVPYSFEGTSSFSDAELSRIQNIWARVAEDYAMYSIDVTTEDPGVDALRYNGSGDESYGIRVVISPTSDFYPGAGGVAYVGSFDWNSDTPTFVFSGNLGNGNEKYVTDATSHEVGHTLGLSHDGKTDGTAYYSGHGDWAPIMGVGYYQPITQWSKGEYAGANNHEDDLTVMLNNGASYRPDDHGDWINTATMLSGDVLSAAGLIERRDDTDIFGFQTETGDIIINADPAHLDPNLDILLQVIDAGGNVVGEADPYYILPADISLNLPAGTYYLLIDGVGTGDPDTGYTDYASLGQYFISVSLPVPQNPPADPSGLSAFAVSSSEISLSWTDNSGNENGFAIERSPNGIDNWSEIGSTSANITWYTDSALSHDSTYYYRVSAYNSIGGSGYSNTADATTLGLVPAPPSGLSATAISNSIIDLNWTDSADNETGFSVERSPNGADNWQEIATVVDNSTAYSDTGLDSGTTYYYQVAAYNSNGSSGYSNQASATTAEVQPESPTGLTAAPSSYSQINLNWQDNSANETGFRIERSDDGISWAVITESLPVNSTGYADNTVSAGSTYYYRVLAFNSAGPSGYSNTAVATTDEPPQYIDQTASQEVAVAGSVSGTVMETQADDSVVEAITERTSGGRPSSRYSYMEHKWIFQVQAGTTMMFFAQAWTDAAVQGDTIVFYYSTDDQNYTEMFAVTADYDDDSYQAFALPENFSGSVYIKVQDMLRTPGLYNRSTLYVDHLFIRTDNEPGTLPASPSALLASAVSFDTVSLTWTDNSNNELGFSIERSPDGSGGWSQIGTVAAGITSYVDNGLSTDTMYFYRILAFNSSGSSDFSNMASATTLPFQGDTMHISGLSGSSSVNHNRWEAQISVMVKDRDNIPVMGAAVEGSWDIGGSSTCITDTDGICWVSNTKIKTSVAGATFTVQNVSRAGYVYDPASNVADFLEVLQP